MMPDYSYLPLSKVRKYEPEMRRLGVSKVARSPSGFLSAYKRAEGNPRNLSENWKTKRRNFIKRHLAQHKPSHKRRRLALIAWAYDPQR